MSGCHQSNSIGLIIRRALLVVASAKREFPPHSLGDCSPDLAASTSQRISGIVLIGHFRRLKLQLWQTVVCSKLRQNLLIGAAKILVMIGRAGMDSSRSGLLSTILMTLPLIVVPAVALLRPPGQVGVSTVDLEASDGEEDDSMFDGFDGFDADASGSSKKERIGHSVHDHDQSNDRGQGSKAEDDTFRDMDSPDAETQQDFSPRTPPPRGTNKDPFLDDAVPHQLLPMKRRETEQEPLNGSDSDPAKPDAGQIVEELNAMGALKTMWFEADDKTPVGLAVFFRGQTEGTRIRFEAVGPSREECASNILEQVMRWRQQNPVQ